MHLTLVDYVMAFDLFYDGKHRDIMDILGLNWFKNCSWHVQLLLLNVYFQIKSLTSTANAKRTERPLQKFKRGIPNI